MDRFFNMDNKFFTAMNRIADLIILNLLCLVLCIPVITIGPALTALFYMTLKMVRNEESYIVRGFFHSFKENFRQGLVINLIMLAAGGLLWLDFSLVNQMEGTTAIVMYFLLMIVLMLYLMVFTYIYPVLAKFVNTIKGTFTNAFLMSIRHLPYTLLMILATVVPIVAIYFASGQLQGILTPLYLLLAISSVAYVNSHFLVKIFDQYIPKEEGEEDLTEMGQLNFESLDENTDNTSGGVNEESKAQA
ncbi:MAG: DUF624 domain-containing protein [Blautia sp.]|nr:DUF624 domain-containing protein [Blautia sp.]